MTATGRQRVHFFYGRASGVVHTLVDGHASRGMWAAQIKFEVFKKTLSGHGNRGASERSWGRKNKHNQNILYRILKERTEERERNKRIQVK